ncbi:hypothetical protein EZJ55_20305 [Microcystis aeruginosa EAWAG127a]|uniref:Uncharacterized protein n=1 Tax=Microcystis aeruginosa EAWAG127a TaxID=2529855 RepID=A0A5J5LZF9_MICAE|nr:hypothetical protein EZJ55_20305 [Microcystis aeruginosa EAWAG127a]
MGRINKNNLLSPVSCLLSPDSETTGSLLLNRLSWIWWVKCILRYIPPSEGVERTTKTQRTQRLIDPMSVKLITQNLEEPSI